MTPLSPQPVALGKSGLTVSPLAWGMWRFAGRDVTEARTLVEAALESGITLLDTADIYGLDGPAGFGGAEALLGEVLRAAPGLRARMVLATKGGIVPGVPYDSSAAYLRSALEASLKRLGVEQVDLWQVHRPDLLTHPAELAETLAAMVASGKVRAVGVSNFTVAEVRALQAHLTVPLASIQPEFSVWHDGILWDGVLDQAMELGLSVLAWSPLGRGAVAEEGAVSALLDAKAEAAGVSRSAAAYAWIMTHPARPIPIVGSQQVARIKEAHGAYAVAWTRAEWYALLQASMDGNCHDM